MLRATPAGDARGRRARCPRSSARAAASRPALPVAPRALRATTRDAARPRPARAAGRRARTIAALETALATCRRSSSRPRRDVPGDQADDRLPELAHRPDARVGGARRRAVDRAARCGRTSRTRSSGWRARRRTSTATATACATSSASATRRSRPPTSRPRAADRPRRRRRTCARARCPRADRKPPPLHDDEPCSSQPVPRLETPSGPVGPAAAEGVRGEPAPRGPLDLADRRDHGRSRLLCGGYILNKQRLESPLAERYTLKPRVRRRRRGHARGSARRSRSPGVDVGQIDGVELTEGRGVAAREHGPGQAAARLRGRDRRARPEHAAEGHAGAAVARQTATGEPLQRRRDDRRCARRRRPVDADELLRALDADTRDWVRSLIADLGVGTQGPQAATCARCCATSARPRRRCARSRACSPTAAAHDPPARPRPARRHRGDRGRRRRPARGGRRGQRDAGRRSPRTTSRCGDARRAAARRSAPRGRRSAGRRRSPRRCERSLDRARPDARGARRARCATTPGALRGARAAADRASSSGFIDAVGAAAARTCAPRRATSPRRRRRCEQRVRRARPHDGPPRATRPRTDSQSYLFWHGLVRAQPELDLRDAGRARRGACAASCCSRARRQRRPASSAELLEQVLGTEPDAARRARRDHPASRRAARHARRDRVRPRVGRPDAVRVAQRRRPDAARAEAATRSTRCSTTRAS